MIRRVCPEVVPGTKESPLTLSLSPWERGRCGIPRGQFRGPFSHGEKDRMRGGTTHYRRTWGAAFAGLALAFLAPAPANAWSLWTEMIEQISIKPQEKPMPFPQRSVPVPGTATMRVPDQDSAAAFVNPVKATAESVNTGKQLFGIYCTPCHGVSGTGNGLVGEKLTVRPFDLTSDAVQSLSDGFIFGYLTFRGTVMPSYANDLSPTERWHVINYLHHGLKPPVQLTENPAK
jgi:S-disulfanyl-L-cysteine oxidoreductase SoxD